MNGLRFFAMIAGSIASFAVLADDGLRPDRNDPICAGEFLEQGRAVAARCLPRFEWS